MGQFMVLQLIGLALCIIFPDIALWFPRWLFGPMNRSPAGRVAGGFEVGAGGARTATRQSETDDGRRPAGGDGRVFVDRVAYFW